MIFSNNCHRLIIRCWSTDCLSDNKMLWGDSLTPPPVPAHTAELKPELSDYMHCATWMRKMQWLAVVFHPTYEDACLWRKLFPVINQTSKFPYLIIKLQFMLFHKINWNIFSIYATRNTKTDQMFLHSWHCYNYIYNTNAKNVKKRKK